MRIILYYVLIQVVLSPGIIYPPLSTPSALPRRPAHRRLAPRSRPIPSAGRQRVLLLLQLHRRASKDAAHLLMYCLNQRHDSLLFRHFTARGGTELTHSVRRRRRHCLEGRIVDHWIPGFAVLCIIRIILYYVLYYIMD